MSRIKLPGKEKNKRILLFVLVLIALGIIAHEFIENRNSKDNKYKEEKEIVMPEGTQQSDNNVANKELESIDMKNDSKKAVDDKTNEKSSYSERENELYDEAYNLFFSHKYIESISKADLLISEFPSNAMGYNIRGIAKSYNGDFNSGIDDIDKALSIDNNYGYARFNKALTYELYGKMDDALEWYNKALDVEDYEWSYYGIASIYGRRGDIKNTMLYLNKAIQMDASIKEIAKEEHDFDTVKNSEEFKKAVYN
ncbi:tetratricopeptide repeat protein [Clostridium beijerinckii]|jgi:Tetratricopeptide repeat.|uniref:Uncharacterized protein n=2 Tax=Clostridium beijerinckii TaxID=1520 RepID=A0A1S8RRI0_CLOBE|nr:hypothetical protein [Clostridium beijerinckii]ABR32381.1 TPR repeat-containing protein [Clostridium beijerinckii NCIMB 8052]AIU03922.1 TPR repeat-containing protein [Clostridium beijerinckii ATCC 35702]MBF7807941.1 hypothetical protein [Clostridium beijerinckii]NRT21503.1 tetratricopeptide (TPR) repeat protein [Clostridium beijerinckii]NRT65996.1 tetratricopeptide (TPR) repeat protein [Clostridium beijerinckii]